VGSGDAGRRRDHAGRLYALGEDVERRVGEGTKPATDIGDVGGARQADQDEVRPSCNRDTKRIRAGVGGGDTEPAVVEGGAEFVQHEWIVMKQQNVTGPGLARCRPVIRRHHPHPPHLHRSL
jgi:hypothetical protein